MALRAANTRLCVNAKVLLQANNVSSGLASTAMGLHIFLNVKQLMCTSGMNAPSQLMTGR